jgi:DNA polymerase-4
MTIGNRDDRQLPHTIMSQTIMHLDMDAFYAAIEQLDNPELVGKPVIVGASPDKRGVVATASYEARAFGVHSAMPSRTAGRLCPNGVFVPVRMSRYAEVSGQLMDVLESFTPLVEKISVDEAFMDVTGVLHLWKDTLSLARAIKDRIRAELKLTGSIGVAPNKFLAKLSSDMDKPDGLTVAPTIEKEIIAFLAPLPVGRLWGVGGKTNERLNSLGIHTVEHIQQRPMEELRTILGERMAAHLSALAHGRDERSVETGNEEKSISNEMTYGEDCRDPARVRETLLRLAEKVSHRLRRSGKLATTAQIKLRFSDFRTITRQLPLQPATDNDRSLLNAAVELFEKENVREPIRLVGFGVSNLSRPGQARDEEQQLLFPALDSDLQDEKDTKLDHALDEIRERFGTGSVGRAGGKGRNR